jgi:glycosyltransferase involved in cell wall biosynthesis
MASLSPRLVMLGPAPGTHGAIAGLIEIYRERGLFKRWPIEFVAASGEGLKGTLRAVRNFALLLLQERNLAVHVHAAAGAAFWREALFMALAAAARCPFILHLHGAGFERFYDEAGSPGRHALRFFLENAACVVVPCESLRTWLRGAARRAQVACVPNPVVALEAPAAARQPNLVLFLGKLDAVHGVFDVLEAVSALRPAVPDVRLICAGDGDRAAVARHAESLGIADAVKFTGWVGPSGKRALLESAAAFALPSYDEALPTSLLEAMAAGLPVVASPVGGIPEVLVDGVNGFLCAPGDVSSLQRLLRKLLIEPNLGARMGAAARESVRLRHAPERSLARLEELYAGIGLTSFGVPAAHKPAN